MEIQADLKDAIESGRDDLIGVLASHGLLPAVVEGTGSGESSLLGRSSSPTFRLEARGSAGGVDRQTTIQVVDALGLDSEADCEAVREEIREHAAWEGS
jgi:hypothetical protein